MSNGENSFLVEEYIECRKFPKDNFRNELLFEFCSIGNSRLVTKILEYPELDLDMEFLHPNMKKMNALDVAAQENHLETVKLLIEIQRIQLSKSRAIYLAAKYGHSDMLEFLLEQQCNLSFYPDDACFHVSDYWDNPSFSNGLAIQIAAGNGHLDCVKMLLKDGRFNPSNCMHLNIRSAASNGHAEIVELLLKDGRSDPHSCHCFALRHASKNGHHLVVKILLRDKRVDPNVSLGYSLRLAAHNNHLEVVKLLIQDERVKHVGAAVLIACLEGHTDIVKELLLKQQVASLVSHALTIAKNNGQLEIEAVLQNVVKKS